MITNGAGGGQLATIQKQPSISHKARDEIAEAVAMVAILGQARAEAKVRQVAGQNAGRDIQHGKLVGGQLATIQKQPSIRHQARP